MGNTKSDTEDKLQIKLSEIPLKSSLGLLAYGDIAFEAWRELKRKSKKEQAK